MLFRQNNSLQEDEKRQGNLVDRIKKEQEICIAALTLRFSNLEKQAFLDRMPKEKEIKKSHDREYESEKFQEAKRLSKELELEVLAFKNPRKRVAELQELYKDPEFEFWNAFAKFIFQSIWKDHAPSDFYCHPEEFNFLVETMKKEGKKIPDGNCCEGFVG